MEWNFPLHVVKQNIKQHGKSYLFQRYKKDERGQETTELEKVCEVPALYHISKGYVTKSVNDYGTITSKGQPMLLCVSSDVESVKINDIVIVGSFLYRVNSLNDLNNEGKITDISLELVNNGK